MWRKFATNHGTLVLTEILPPLTSCTRRLRWITLEPQAVLQKSRQSSVWVAKKIMEEAFWEGVAVNRGMGQRTEPRERKDISTQAAAAPKYVTTCQRGRNRSSLGSGRGWGGMLWLLKP